MNENAFTKEVRKEFAFLFDDYDFQIDKESSEPARMGNAGVVLVSSNVLMSIVKDRGQVLINIGEVSKPREEWFEFADVIRFFSADENLDVYQFRTNPYDVPPIDRQLSRLAWLAREYCSPIFRGDFSMKDSIKSLEKVRLAALLKRPAKR
jgi:hypothetical protein